MIAFDIDGVFCPDIIIRDDLDDLLRFRTHSIKALFKPKGPYCLITGRPSIDREDTMKFVTREFEDNLPQTIYHDNDDLINSVEYKAKVLNDDRMITIFVESDPMQAEAIALKMRRSIEILTFQELIELGLNNL